MIMEGDQGIRDICEELYREIVILSRLIGFIMFGCKISQFGQSMIARDLGVGVSFFDYVSLGPLILQFSRGPQLTDTSAKAKLQEVISNGQWNWPLISDIEYLDTIYFLPTIHRGDDCISWRVEGGHFSNQEAYALFHPPRSKVGWSSLLLDPLKIPRNNFILLLAILGKLSTLDKPWLNHLDGTCIRCSKGQPETHAHLFFSCPDSRMCISVIRQHVRFSLPHHDWLTDVHWAAVKWRGKHVINTPYRTLLPRWYITFGMNETEEDSSILIDQLIL
ncbi:UNVERIFIED_CONTAM: hypothetical protein Slati_3162000 [Sesamum latifolium]|uniref:Reverse transcriptase zinc-binding domain-containing protein n=1 Tax=Sesamum latifolium TaxID=2727402 RepID=A0AAW2V1S9_9LAMI